MNLSQREKMLAYGVGAASLLALLVLAWQFGLGGDKSYSDLVIEQTKLSEEVKKNQNRLDAAMRATAKLDDWQRRALPGNPDAAHALYQNWLRKIVKDSGFQKTKIDAANRQTIRGVGEELKYTIEGQASLKQLTKFLYYFYDSGNLHKITYLKINPLEKTEDFSISVTVAAMSLNTADHLDRLTEEKGKRLQRKSFDDYAKMIGERNVFSPPKPPKVTPPTPPATENKTPPPSKFDHLEFTKLTGITASDGQPSIWLETKTKDQKYKVREGDTIAIESAEIKVLHIGTRDAELEIGGEKRTIKLGQNLLGK
jgi:hypothetical protein